MFQKLSRTAVALALGGMLMTTGVMAQNATMFGDKLGVMPRTPANSATINGTGTVTY
jgi:hypothetical protein